MNPNPASLLAGQKADGLVLRSHWEPGPECVWLEVVYAEPLALFSGPLLRQVRRGEALPFTEVDRVEVGGILRIRARNRTLVYRLTGHDTTRDIYTGEWPD